MRKNKNFNLLIGSQLFSVLGTTIVQFVISLYVLDITKSALTFSVIASLSIIGRLICLPFCGVLADRLPKRNLMLLMDCLYLVLSVGLFLVTRLADPVTAIGILTVIIGMVSAFETPVVQSAIPVICSEEEIPRANGIISSIGTLGTVLGPIIAGIIYRFDAVYQIFAITGGLFLIAILCEVVLNIPKQAQAAMNGTLWQVVVGDLKEVTHYLKAQKVIVKVAIVAFLLNFFLASFIQVIIPYVSRIQLGVSDAQFGLMNTILAIGSLLGTVIYGIIANRLNETSISKNLILVAILFGLLVIPFGLIQDPTVAFWVMTIIVASAMGVVTVASVQLIVYIQLVSDKALLGRIMSLVMIVTTLAIPLGQVMYGGFAAAASTEMLLVLIVATSLVTVLIAIFSIRIFKQMRVENEV
ncbi:MFS transporter [Enterococcus hulanensis]|uniref:MFS transporter n=1 Tax=Enterococcus hulanensis TaxID=2559929 RepID=A0ABU3ETH4_9ENTE|nr:MFS transporter [Enterococcus hulanensis]MDT2598168.1 MFS transporter [Enterococcus hulanensis]MDT2608327.1 MFS transporter [Enterococcus hulanensis]MDT2615622.1 MFS transporter [Enterococcus hulanensis]MDT2626407.1 MFS transporter [Enterococcus hulanensis]MDT2654694.1 MFS transporter [Enterococcus hulanensis]